MGVHDTELKYGDENQSVLMRESIYNIYAGCQVNEKKLFDQMKFGTRIYDAKLENGLKY